MSEEELKMWARRICAGFALIYSFVAGACFFSLPELSAISMIGAAISWITYEGLKK